MLFYDDRMYSFIQDSKFSIPVETDVHHVTYYISRETYANVAYSSRRLRQLENRVEQDAYKHFTQQCDDEKSARRDLITNAKYYEETNAEYFEYYIGELEKQAQKEGYQACQTKRQMERTDERR